jgi:hypothetical protein
MARIAGVDLPRQKHINIALTYIYGIGHPRAGQILDEAKVDPMKKVQDLSEEEVNRIRTVIEAQGMVEGDLRKRSAQGSFDEHQAAHRNRLLSRLPSPPQPAGSWTADTYECAHPQGPAQGNGIDQEEGDVENVRPAF